MNFEHLFYLADGKIGPPLSDLSDSQPGIGQTLSDQLPPGAMTSSIQTQMYVNYFDRHVKLPDELPTIGIVLCRRKNDALVELTLPKDANIFASKYQLYLPSKEELKARLVTSGELNYNVITDTLEKISSEAVAETNLTIHPEGTFLMAITGLEAEGTRGACGIIGAPSTTNQSCMAVLPTDALAGEYLFHYYVFRGRSLALQYCQGTKQQSYTASLVKQLPIDLPPTLPEQTAIAKVLTEMDGELAVLEQRREKTRALKQAMMQELLTGRTRLVTTPQKGGRA